MESEALTLTSLLNSPIVLVALGWIAAKWREDRGAHTKAVQVDTDLLARLKFVEQWVSDHNTIHGCVQSLKATTDAIAANVDRIIRLIDADPYELTQRARPPVRRRGYTPPGWIDELPEDWRPL